MVITAACATSGGTGESKEEGGDAATRRVVVRNDNFADVHVYLVRPGGGRTDLGLAPSYGDSEFTVPVDRLIRDAFHVLVDPVGGGPSQLIRDIVFPADAEVLRVIVSAEISLSHVVIE